MTFTFYSTSWCGPFKRLKGQLTEHGISFQEVDIEQSPEAVALVESLNNGNQMVPTLVFSDGTSLTNPSAAAGAAAESFHVIDASTRDSGTNSSAPF
jgi:mycoredoxin